MVTGYNEIERKLLFDHVTFYFELTRLVYEGFYSRARPSDDIIRVTKSVMTAMTEQDPFRGWTICLDTLSSALSSGLTLDSTLVGAVTFIRLLIMNSFSLARYDPPNPLTNNVCYAPIGWLYGSQLLRRLEADLSSSSLAKASAAKLQALFLILWGMIVAVIYSLKYVKGHEVWVSL